MHSSEEAPVIKDGARIDGLQISRVLHDDGTVVSAMAKRIGKPGRLLLHIANPDKRRDHDASRMLEQEAAGHGMLEHPALSTFIDMGRAEGLVWYARQWTEGPSMAVLGRQLADMSYTPYGHLAHIFASLARGLHEAHSGIVRGEPLSMPFGVMRPDHIRLNRRGRFTLGGYQPQDSPRPLCRRPGALASTDLRRLAELLFELSTGQTVSAAMQEAGLNQPPPPSSIVLGYPEDLEDILMCALSPDETTRFPDGVAMASVLENFAATSRWHADQTKVLEWIAGLFPSWRLELNQSSWSNDFGNGPSTDEVTAWFTPPSFSKLLTGDTSADPEPEEVAEPAPAPFPSTPPPTGGTPERHYADLEAELAESEFFDDETPSLLKNVLADGDMATVFEQEEPAEASVAPPSPPPRTPEREPAPPPPPPRAQTTTANLPPEPMPQVQWASPPEPVEAAAPPPEPEEVWEEPVDRAPAPPPAPAAAPPEAEDPAALASALAASLWQEFQRVADELVRGERSRMPLVVASAVALFALVGMVVLGGGAEDPGYQGDTELVATFVLGEAETLLAKGEHTQVELALREVRLLGKVSPTTQARATRVGEDLDIARAIQDVQRAVQARQFIQAVDTCETILRQRPGHPEVLAVLKTIMAASEGRGSAGAAADRARFLIQNGGG